MSRCSVPLLVRLLERAHHGMHPAEVAGGGYRPQVAAFTVEDDGWAALAEPVRFTRVPAHTAVGVEVTARGRTWTLPTREAVAIAADAEVLIPVGALLLRWSEGPPAATGEAAGGPSTVGADAVPLPVGAALGDGESPGSQADTHG